MANDRRDGRGSLNRCLRVTGILLLSLLPFRRLVAAPIELYARLPALEDVQLSPDGQRVAFVLTSGDQRVVAVKSLETGRVMGSIRVGTSSIRDLSWADNTC